jgi:hypothetical protein
LFNIEKFSLTTPHLLFVYADTLPSVKASVFYWIADPAFSMGLLKIPLIVPAK